MSNIKYVEGDLFAGVDRAIQGEIDRVYIPHVVNDKNKWGKGFVVPLAKRYPSCKETYHEFPQTMGCVVCCSVERGKVGVLNMCAQSLGGERPLRYDYLSECMREVALHIKFVRGQNSSVAIHCPLFGSGLAGGNWEFIHELIEDHWDACGIDVTIYYLKDHTPVGFGSWLRENDL